MMIQQRTCSWQRTANSHVAAAIARLVVCMVAVAALAGCGTVTVAEPDAVADAPVADAPVADAPIADAPGADAMPCTQGEAQVEDPATGHCYMLFLASENWTTARDLCAAVSPDTHLATITSQAEHDLVRPLIGSRDVWIGANDLAQTGTWAWITGEPFDYTNWDGGQPNDATEHCVRADGDYGGRWHDDGCGDRWPFLCERP
jgi:hypothetical protein